MKKDKRKYHYENQLVDPTATNWGIFNIVLAVLTGGVVLYMIVSGEAYAPENRIIFWSNVVIAISNALMAGTRLDAGEKTKKVRVYDEPERDPSKENVSDKDALNDILGGK